MALELGVPGRQLDGLARTDVAGPLLDLSVVDGVLEASPKQDAPVTEYRVAIYAPDLVGTGGGRGSVVYRWTRSARHGRRSPAGPAARRRDGTARWRRSAR